MENERDSKGVVYFQRWVSLIFLILAMCLTVLVFVYWATVLEPQLISRARITARSIVKANTSFLPGLLEHRSENDSVAGITTILNRLLILTDSESGKTYIQNVALEIDYDVIPVKKGVLDIVNGSSANKDNSLSEIPLYSAGTKELMGILKFSVNPDFIDAFLKRIKISFLIGTGAGIALLITAWLVVAGLLVRIRFAEKTIKEKQAQVIHAGRLTAMGEMATGIAHELNQPLAIIRIGADGLLSYFSNHAPSRTMEKTAVEKIIAQVERAATIINNMRAFARTGNDNVSWTDLSEPIKNALSFFREQFRIHNIGLTVDLPDNEVRVLINAQKFEQIVVNLLSNARFAVDKKQEVSPDTYQKEVALRLDEDPEKRSLVFEVSDNGVGMSQQVLERCREPFYTTKGVGEGTGLGLSIVHSIVTENNMEMDIKSVEEKGSVFRIILKREKLVGHNDI